jgi:glycosyltransferase involved in cell wall biosynthesis
MRLAIVSDVYPPLRSSGAVQLRDLSRELVRQGHHVTMFVACPDLDASWRLEDYHGVRVLRVKSPRTKDVGFIRRAVAESAMPFVMLRNFRKSPVVKEQWDGVIWYSPTIFLGPIVSFLRGRSRCPTYLIIRDIFPEWAVDMGLMGRGPPYWYFRAVARYQYSIADIIGIQTPGNAVYFREWARVSGRRLEVLHNWLAPAPVRGCSISIADTALAGRKIIVYAGNMGVAQGLDVMISLAERMQGRHDIGFLFVGRGSETDRLRERAADLALRNVLFFGEIDPDEIPALYAQCHVGLVSLDLRHRTHNIPGKFLTYMQAGLPVLALVNPGNDIVELIRAERVGRACTEASVDVLLEQVNGLFSDLEWDDGLSERCRALSWRLFSVESAARQVVCALEGRA